MGSLGVEWVQNYNGRAANVGNTRAAAEGFYNTLLGVRSFDWGDDLAWDEDFEQKGWGSPDAGTDISWADKVDILFFAGHGSAQGPFFGTTRDSGEAAPGEVRWGDRELEWIAFHACQVLNRKNVFDRWWDAFAGLHYMLGFHSNAQDEPNRGRYFAEKLNAGWRVRDAWIHACQETEGGDREWAYLRADAEGTNTFEDHWHGRGFVSPDPSHPNVLYYLRGSC